MAIFDPSKYEDEAPKSDTDFLAPDGKYELYFSELGVQTKYDDQGNELKNLNGKVVFMDGPRAGKYFYHTFWIFNPDKDKRKQALTWMGNFFRSIDVGAIDIDTDCDQLINKTFIGEVEIEEWKGKKRNKLIPWGFHKVGGDAPLAPKPSTSKPQSSGGSSGPTPHEDDLIPF